MSVDKIKKDVLNILELSPDWIEGSNKNPLRTIIQESKTHELLLLLRSLYGIVDGNPMIKRINKVHYPQDKVQLTLEKIVKAEKTLNSSAKYSSDFILDVIAILSQIEYLKVYPNRYSDTFIKAIVKNNLFGQISNRAYRAKLLFLLIRMGYSNIYIDRELKRLELSQNIDGGWGNLKGDRSNIFCSLLVFQCYRENRLWRDREVVLKLESYLIKNHLSKNETKSEQDKWNRIHSGYKFNNMFEGGSLILLESMLISSSSNNKSKIKSLIKWIVSLQLDSGCFPYHADLRKQENIVTSIRILSCLKKYYLQNNQ